MFVRASIQYKQAHDFACWRLTERLLSALPLDASRKHQTAANLFYLSFPSKNPLCPVQLFHQIVRLAIILMAGKCKCLNLFLKMGNFLMFWACPSKPGSISEKLVFSILQTSSHSPFKRTVCVMAGEISYSYISLL